MKIKVESCSDPIKCARCVEICPAKIFILKPHTIKKRDQQIINYKIRPLFKSFCNGCMKCVETCPENRIRIEF